MSRKRIGLSVVGSVIVILSLRSGFAAPVDYQYIIDSESRYLDSCVVSSGAIIMGQSMQYTFQGTPHYKICPYFSNFASIALLDNPTSSNVVIVKNWMIWVFNHLNADGSIYDYYVDKMTGGTELPSIDAYAREKIPDFDSKDSYAATFMTLARRYVEVVPVDTLWLRGYSKQLESIGNALYSVVDDSVHQFSSDNNDGLTEAKTDYQVKYTMDNSEVNEGLRDMVWLEQNISTFHNSSFYQNLLDNNTTGFGNLWNDSTATYYPYEGSPTADWNTFYADATCQLYPVWCGVISPLSSRASGLWNTFNSHYPGWQNGTHYDPYPWTIICYVAAVMDDSSRVNSYLSYVEELLEKGQNPPNWYNSEAAFTLRAARRISTLTGVKGTGQQIPQSPQLEQNYPNPFNPSTVISFLLPQANSVKLVIYDVLGREVRTLVNGNMPAGVQTAQWVGRDAWGITVGSGVYFYRLTAGSFVATRKMIVEK